MAGWLREEQPDLAAEKILDAAEKAFVEEGVSAAGMSTVAEYAGCSRGTVYRYFPTRDALDSAYVDRWARRIVERLRPELSRVDDPEERVVEAVVRSVRAVRETPETAVWFASPDSGRSARISRSSEVVEALTTAFVVRLLGAGTGTPDGALRAQWLVRVIVSLLTVPGASEAEERALVERFVAPALLG